MGNGQGAGRFRKMTRRPQGNRSRDRAFAGKGLRTRRGTCLPVVRLRIQFTKALPCGANPGRGHADHENLARTSFTIPSRTSLHGEEDPHQPVEDGQAAQSPGLRAALRARDRRDGVDRLEQVFAIIEEPAKGKTCDATNGILDEGKKVMRECKGSPALDAGLLAAAQAVEHYEISRYGTLKTWAEELGLDQAVKLLDQTLQEDKEDRRGPHADRADGRQSGSPAGGRMTD